MNASADYYRELFADDEHTTTIGNTWVCYVRVADVEAVVERARALGATRVDGAAARGA